MSMLSAHFHNVLYTYNGLQQLPFVLEFYVCRLFTAMWKVPSGQQFCLNYPISFLNIWVISFYFYWTIDGLQWLLVSSKVHCSVTHTYFFLIFLSIMVYIGCWIWSPTKEMGIPDHLICILRNLYAGQEATVRTGHGTTDWFQIGKGVRQGCILSPFI